MNFYVKMLIFALGHYGRSYPLHKNCSYHYIINLFFRIGFLYVILYQKQADNSYFSEESLMQYKL